MTSTETASSGFCIILDGWLVFKIELNWSVLFPGCTDRSIVLNRAVLSQVQESLEEVLEQGDAFA